MSTKWPRGSWGLDSKSLGVGLLLGLCAVLATGAIGDNRDHVGQYQCGAAGDDPLGVFVVDTETGHTWRFGRTDTIDYGTSTNRRSVRRSERPTVD